MKPVDSTVVFLPFMLFQTLFANLPIYRCSLYQDAKYMVNYSKYEITPVEPYTSDDLNWTNSSSRVSREHDDESLRDIALTEITPADWDSYDTVLIGA